MSIELHDWTVLERVRDRLSDKLPDRLADLAAADGLGGLRVPSDWRVVSDDFEEPCTGGVFVLVSSEESIEEDFMTPQTDVMVSLRVRVVYRESNVELRERDGLRYARAVSEVLTGDVPDSDLWHVDVTSRLTEPYGTESEVRAGVTRATAWLRTTRAVVA